MKIAFWALFLSGFLLVAGCGGIHDKLPHSSLPSSPGQLIQELTLFPSGRANMDARVSPATSLLPEIQTEELAPSSEDAELNFCFVGQLPLDEFSPSSVAVPGTALALLRKEWDAAGSEKQMDPRVSPATSLLPEIQTEELAPSSEDAELNFCFVGQLPLDEFSPSSVAVPGTALALLRKEWDAGGSEKQMEESLPLDSSPGAPSQKSSLEQGTEGHPSVAVEPPPPEPSPAASTEALEEFSAQRKEIFGQDEMARILAPSHLSLGTSLENKNSEGETAAANNSTAFPKLLNDRVKTYIDLFQNKADHFFTKSLARSQAYEGIIRPILREKNLPEELLYLALIESGYDPYAQSRAKATGIWQFMKGTAKRFGLRVDPWVDERRDPEKSTLAAADYLKSLYETFNCWFLAAAGYNAGEAKILQAMKRAKSQDFWAISKHRYLKRETKEYVPRLLAAIIIAQDPSKYGFSNIDYQPPLVYEKVVVPSGVRLDRIARAAETTVEELRALNPALRRNKTPPHDPSFEIKLPPGKKEAFERNFSRVFKLDPRTARKHLVRRGDTLWQIAKKYKVDLRELCEGNEINPKTLIRPGMILLLPP